MACENGNLVAFSPDGKYFAFFSSAGVLRIWETATSILNQEHRFDTRLSLNAKCLVWCRAHKSKSPRKQGLRSGFGNEEKFASDLIAFGTESGNVLLYSLVEKNICKKLEKGHAESVNSASQHLESDSFFSCSDDQHVIHWNWSEGKVKFKWKADRSSIHSVYALDAHNLLSASSNIKWWNVDKRTLIKRFTGHGGDVFCLLPVHHHHHNDTVEGSYFISAARTDYLISAWHLKKEDKSNSALVSFRLSDEPVSLDVSLDSSENKNILTAVTKCGVLHTFKHQLNGKCPRPLQPSMTVDVLSSRHKDSNGHPLCIPILSTHICNGSQSVLVAHGSSQKPTFESLTLDSSQSEIHLSSSISMPSASPLVSRQENLVEMKENDESPDGRLSAKVSPSCNEKICRNKQSLLEKNDDAKQDLTFSPKSKSSKYSKECSEKQESPHFHIPNLAEIPVSQITNYIQQGIEKKDTELLNTIFSQCDDTLMRKVIENIPRQAVLPLLSDLHWRLSKYETKSYTYLRWMKVLLQVHAKYIILCDAMNDDILSHVAHLLKNRSETFLKLSQLKGQLHLLLSQEQVAHNRLTQVQFLE